VLHCRGLLRKQHRTLAVFLNEGQDKCGRMKLMEKGKLNKPHTREKSESAWKMTDAAVADDRLEHFHLEHET
jgi:hypothetical protein